MQQDMQRWVDKVLLPGVTAAVVGPQGVWSGTAGVDGGGTPLAPTSGMALGGVTVTFTAAEVLLLAEQGKVECDAPASTYVKARQVANGVTVRQLMAHRAGIPDPGDDRYAKAFAEPDRRWSPQDALASVAKPTEAPGKRFHYDNTNYPAGPVIPVRSIASAVGASGGVAGDAESTARWGYDLYGAHVLRPESVRQMTDFSDGDGYGLGTVDFSAPSFQRSSIQGIGHMGGMPGYRSVLAVYPDQQLSVAILTPSTVEAWPYVKWLVKEGQLLGAAP